MGEFFSIRLGGRVGGVAYSGDWDQLPAKLRVGRVCGYPVYVGIDCYTAVCGASAADFLGMSLGCVVRLRAVWGVRVSSGDGGYHLPSHGVGDCDAVILSGRVGGFRDSVEPPRQPRTACVVVILPAADGV